MIPSVFIIFSPVLSLVAGFFYIRDTLKGTTKPNRVSFFLWALAPLIGSAISFHEGAGYSVIPVFMAGFIPLLIFIASFVNKNAYWKLTLLDYVCGIFSAIALILWLVIHIPTVAFIFAILTDLLAYIPTLIKAWKSPETETGLLYILPTFGNIIGLLILDEWSFTTYGFSLYLILANIVCISFLYRKKIKYRQKEKGALGS